MLIDFEGIDGSGKRTQALLLERELSRRDFRVVLYSYPDYESVYGRLISSFLEGIFSLSPDEQFLLYLLDIVRNKHAIWEQLRAHHVAIMDRYFLSTVAYQSANRFDYEAAKQIVTVIGLPLPSIVFYLDTPVDVALSRKRRQKGTGDRFEENRTLLAEVATVYEKLMAERFACSNWIRLNGADDPEVTHQAVVSEVCRLVR